MSNTKHRLKNKPDIPLFEWFWNRDNGWRITQTEESKRGFIFWTIPRIPAKCFDCQNLVLFSHSCSLNKRPNFFYQTSKLMGNLNFEAAKLNFNSCNDIDVEVKV